MTIFGLIMFCIFKVALANIDTPPNQLEWTSYRLMDTKSYDANLNEIKHKGYYPVDVEITGGKIRTYSLIARENIEGYKWAIHTQLTSEQYNTKWNELKSQGYRPIDQESYTLNGKQYYAGIWINENTPWVSYRNLTSDEFNQRFQENQSRNYLPIDVDGYVMNGKLYFSGIFVQNTQNLQWFIRRNILVKDYSSHFFEMSGKGYRLHSNNSYFFSGEQYFASIWVKDDLKWKANRDLTSQSFNNYWNLYRDQGYRLHDVEEYQTASGTRYLGVWVQNDNNLLSWNNQNRVNKLIEDYLKLNPSMGYSVAISQDNTIRYLRGYGMEDETKDQDANSRTVYRLASVSKAITGTLSYILEDRNTLDLQSNVRTVLPNLPKHHTYQLEDLLSNRSMVRHYIEKDPTKKLGNVSSAWQATRAFMNDTLLAGSYKYSTHGYTIMAAAIESKTSRTFCNQISTFISNPHNLTSLNCEFIDRTIENRSALYSYDDSLNKYSNETRDDLSWKYAGGGMESSAYDLVRFGMLLNQNRYMTAARLTHMTTRPDNSADYAFGWNVGSTDGRPWYAKAGDQLGSRTYIRIYPNENIVIVLLGNTYGSNSANLATSIAQELF